MKQFQIAVGEEGFENIRRNGDCYVDKSGLVYELVKETRNKVTLFTRPRRFGKTLTLSMMESFFDITRDSRSLFDGLEVARHEEFCREWMNQCPVLSVSFKDAKALNFDAALEEMRTTLANVCKKMTYLIKSDKVLQADVEIFNRLMYAASSLSEIKSSLLTLTRMLNMHFGKKVILLIDEYDVPLAWANEHNYYAQMLEVVRAVFEYAVKTNDCLNFAVITGCLRLSKESIFTGTNNFVSYSVLDEGFSTYFGFTQAEVEKILEAAEIRDKLEIVKSWYDGYIFGNSAVYCPWDVVRYAADAMANPKTQPRNYWNNTSHNAVIKTFIGRSDLKDVPGKFEILMNGGTIRQTVNDDLTYEALGRSGSSKDSENKLWSILLMTGYLTKADPDRTGNTVDLKIPNKEIAALFQTAVAEHFEDTLDRAGLNDMMQALWNGDEDRASELLSGFLWDTVSYNNYHEDYYHAFLAGILTGLGYSPESDRERGLGRPDVELKDRKNRRALIIETKKAASEALMDRACDEALRQIVNRKYAEDKGLKGYTTILCYGAAFFEKQARVKKLRSPE